MLSVIVLQELRALVIRYFEVFHCEAKARIRAVVLSSILAVLNFVEFLDKLDASLHESSSPRCASRDQDYINRVREASKAKVGQTNYSTKKGCYKMNLLVLV